MSETYIIIGAGQAGGEAAVALRSRGFEGRILLIGDESWPPFERPPLSKQLLAGELEVERTFIKRPDFYPAHDIELRLGCRVASIDVGAHSLTLEGGETLSWDKLLLATGARVRKLAVDGADLAGVHYLRNIDDTLGIRKVLGPDSRLVIVGGGYIGLEVAAVARKMGAEVTVLEALGRVMSRVVAPEVSAFFDRLHREHGVDIRLDTALRALEGDDSGHVAAVRTADGTRIAADQVIIGVGVIPNVELAADAGLAVDNGIKVDDYTATSAPDIFAAGDCTNHPNPIVGGRLRLESVQNAANQAQVAARNMLGEHIEYAEVPWFWSDQYGLKLQMTGISKPGDQVVIRGDMADHKFSALYLRDGVVVALNAVNNMRDFMAAKRLVAAHTRVGTAPVADAAFALKELL